jgi:alpha-tubulin suppressor-like RCC1 family protein
MIDDANKLYSAGYTNTGYIGRTVSSNAHQFVECLTSVDKFAAHDNGCWAIKTDGTLWWCGSISQYAASGDTGQSTVTSSNGWLQYGSDTDWIDIECWTGYPYVTMAIKGGAGSEYLYTCGYNNFGKTGLGTTSGTAKPFTRVKSDAVTDWSETISKVSIGYDATLVVTTGGKLFAFGEGNYGALGQGNTTDSSYPVQAGTDTDWSIPYARARTCSYCIKTDGSLYGSRGSTSEWGMGPTTADRTYRQIGTDTDYEDLRCIENSTSFGKKVLFGKKNGVWYANWDSYITAPSFIGNTASKAPSTNNTWSTINDLLDGNDISVGINDLMLTNKDNNGSAGETLTVATAAT